MDVVTIMQSNLEANGTTLSYIEKDEVNSVDAITTTTAKYLILFRLKMEEVFGDHGDDADIDACSLQTGDSLHDVHGRGTTLHKDGSVYRFTTLIFSDHVASLRYVSYTISLE